MTKFRHRLPVAILFTAPLTVFLVSGGASARAQTPCTAQTTPPPAVTETVTCSAAAINQFFLDSPAMDQLAADQRDAVISHPLRYAFAYMTADAANRLQAGFADKSIQSINYKAILEANDPKGAAAPHNIFQVRMNRAIAGKINWQDLPPGDLFKQAPSQISPWLTKSIAAEDAKAIPPANQGDVTGPQHHPAVTP